MKHFLIFFITVFICLNIYGQHRFAGKIYTHITPSSGYGLGLNAYWFGALLTINSNWIYNDKIIFDGIEYFVGDKVVITGTPIMRIGSWLPDIEIESIARWTSSPDVQNLLGMYEIHLDCYVDKPPWTGDFILGAYPSYDVISDIELAIWNLSDHYIFHIPVSSNNSFLIQEGYCSESRVEGHAAGEGYFKNDSIFMYFKRYDFRYVDNPDTAVVVQECSCKGKKIESSGIVSPSISNSNKVYYDAANQLIIIDETLQNQSSTFELMDLQGKVIFRKTNADYYTPISISNLPNGVYLYRLLLHNKEVYFGKILKHN